MKPMFQCPFFPKPIISAHLLLVKSTKCGCFSTRHPPALYPRFWTASLAGDAAKPSRLFQIPSSLSIPPSFSFFRFVSDKSGPSSPNYGRMQGPPAFNNDRFAFVSVPIEVHNDACSIGRSLRNLRNSVPWEHAPCARDILRIDP